MIAHSLALFSKVRAVKMVFNLSAWAKFMHQTSPNQKTDRFTSGNKSNDSRDFRQQSAFTVKTSLNEHAWALLLLSLWLHSSLDVFLSPCRCGCVLDTQSKTSHTECSLAKLRFLIQTARRSRGWRAEQVDWSLSGGQIEACWGKWAKNERLLSPACLI